MEPPPPHQQRVQALFGRCLLRLQQYELLMKRLLANQAVTFGASGVVPTDPKLAQDMFCKQALSLVEPHRLYAHPAWLASSPIFMDALST